MRGKTPPPAPAQHRQGRPYRNTLVCFACEQGAAWQQPHLARSSAWGGPCISRLRRPRHKAHVSRQWQGGARVMCRARSPLPAAAVLLRPQPQPRRAQGSTRTVHKAAQRSFPAGLVQTETAAAVTLPRYHQIPLLCNAGLSSATDSAHSTGYPPLGRATGSGKRRWKASGAGHACEVRGQEAG